tara:strand:- start:124 stop:516 length:393 start_codon:yes stop_codon:yes gene_type:complete
MKQAITKKQLREFGLVIGIGLPIIIGWLLPLLGGHGFKVWTLFVGIPLFILGLISPQLILYPYKVWIALGHLLGWLNSHIILGLVFIFVLQPIAFIMRLFGYDPLKKRRGKSNTYREDRKGHQTDLTRIF